MVQATHPHPPSIHVYRSDPMSDLANCSPTSLDEASIRAALDSSLRRMKTTYVDLYQIHWPSRYAPVFGQRQYKQVCGSIYYNALERGDELTQNLSGQ